MTGRVTKAISNTATVQTESRETYVCNLRAKLKENNNKILVGDLVSFDDKELVINSIQKRKNEIGRPHVSNIDQLLIVLAPKPKPDFFLIDQLIIMCNQSKIKPIIVMNKDDIFVADFIDDIFAQYGGVCKDIIQTSAKSKTNISKLKEYLHGKLTAIAGQSGVGKSSIIDAIFPDANLKIGDLSQKIQRGSNTTRHTEIYSFDDDIMIMDTPGFSSFEFTGIDPADFLGMYTDIKKYASGCKYASCSHINQSPEICSVAKAVQNGKINKKRYNRFVELYKKYKKEWDNRYDN